jgi:small subunit ribosomal protein S30
MQIIILKLILKSFFRRTFDIKDTNISQKMKSRTKTLGIVQQLNRILINSLGADNHHLQEVDVDIEPRHEAFWFVGGIEPSYRIKLMLEGKEKTKPFANDALERSFHYRGKPLIALRHLHPLLPFEDIDFDSLTGKNEKIPNVTIDPRKYGFVTDHRHGTEIPGFVS